MHMEWENTETLLIKLAIEEGKTLMNKIVYNGKQMEALQIVKKMEKDKNLTYQQLVNELNTLLK